MTNNNPTNLEIIKQACIKANPEIMELKLGCKALIYINSYLFAESIIVGKTESRVYFTREGRSGVERCRIGGDDVNALNCGYVKRIWGRPTTLADVLLALNEKEKFKSNIRSMAINGGFYENGKLIAQWDLTKSLEFQSEDTLNFLAQLLHE